jgi:hypothetical protein
LLSHWFLDLPVHRPDLTLAGFDSKLGLGLWNYPLIAQLVEMGLLLGSYLLVVRRAATSQSEASRDDFARVLCAVQLYAVFAPPPPNVTQMAVSLLVVWLLIAALGARLERTVCAARRKRWTAR